MASNAADARRYVRYEPDEPPPHLVSCGLGLRYAMLAVPSIVLTPTILIQAAGGSAAYLTWAVYAALAISGITTAVQAVGIGLVGAGYVTFWGLPNSSVVSRFQPRRRTQRRLRGTGIGADGVVRHSADAPRRAFLRPADQIDVSLRKTFDVGNLRWDIQADVYNVIDAQPLLNSGRTAPISDARHRRCKRGSFRLHHTCTGDVRMRRFSETPCQAGSPHVGGARRRDF